MSKFFYTFQAKTDLALLLVWLVVMSFCAHRCLEDQKSWHWPAAQSPCEARR